jgi:membrane protein
MSIPPNPPTSLQPASTKAATISRPRPRPSSGLVLSTVKYLMRTEVHTFAFSVAANAILSFFPFLVLMLTLIRRVFHSRVMSDVVVELLGDYLPAGSACRCSRSSSSW